MNPRILALLMLISCTEEKATPLSPVKPPDSASAPAAVLSPVSESAPNVSAPTGETKATFFEGGFVVEATTGVAYLMAPGEPRKPKLTAISLHTEQTYWSTSNAAKPLWVSGSRLLAQKLDGRLVLLSTLDGAEIPSCTLNPELIPPEIYDSLGSSKEIEVSAKGGKIYLSWVSHYRLMQGGTIAIGSYKPPKKEKKIKPTVAVIDPEACTASLLKSPPPGKRPRPRATETLKNNTAEIKFKDDAGKSQTITIRSRDPVLSLQNETYMIVSSISCCSWEIYSFSDGAKVSSFQVDGAFGFSGFAVVGGSFIFDAGFLLEIDGSSGEVIQKRALEPTFYDGPYPQ